MKKINDTIYINELIIPCIIGVFNHERTKKQNIIVSLALSVDLKKAGKTDDINDTVSYHELSEKIGAMIKNSSYQLIETLAEKVAEICLEDKRVTQVTVKIEKPHAIKNAKSSAVAITRNNE